MNGLQLNQQEILAQKKEAWGQMGIGVYQSEQSLSLEAQKSLNDIVLPSKIEEVPQAEETLKEVKKALQTITAKRKEITSKFDDVTARLMAPEKSFADPIKQLTDAIIAVKQEHQKEQAKLKNISDEKIRCREFYMNQKIEAEQRLETKLLNGAAACYENALKTDVDPKDLEAYKTHACGLITDKMFLAAAPSFNAVYLSGEEVLEIATEIWIIDSSSYPTKFAVEIEKKFSDYDVAFNNKAQALANSQKEDEAKKAEISQQATQEQMAVKIESASAVSAAVPTITKELKHGYIVDMEENVDSVLKIFAAFSANLNLCLPFLKVNKWFAFTPAQAATALGKVKCADNNFSPAGITFKQIDKL